MECKSSVFLFILRLRIIKEFHQETLYFLMVVVFGILGNGVEIS